MYLLSAAFCLIVIAHTVESCSSMSAHGLHLCQGALHGGMLLQDSNTVMFATPGAYWWCLNFNGLLHVCSTFSSFQVNICLNIPSIVYNRANSF